jgi:hypothetical protein
VLRPASCYPAVSAVFREPKARSVIRPILYRQSPLCGSLNIEKDASPLRVARIDLGCRLPMGGLP